MFTGLIEEVGAIRRITPDGDGARVRVDGPLVVADAAHGSSIAVNGVCLTVVEQDAAGFTADVMRQTLQQTTIGQLAPDSRVNLERAMSATGRLGGHIVQGHVDGIGRVLSVRPGVQWSVLRVSLETQLAPLVAAKGSIAVDGVSLTVSDVGEDWFEVSLIPETLRATTLGERAPGDLVNLETDVLARHVVRLAEFAGASLRRTDDPEEQER